MQQKNANMQIYIDLSHYVRYNQIRKSQLCEKEKGGIQVIDVNKLKSKIAENGLNIEQMAAKTDMDTSTFYRKLARNGESFTVLEANKICKVLKMKKEEINEIFFAK